jgi:hypothetical protein
LPQTFFSDYLLFGSAYGAMVTIAQPKSPDPLTPQEASELCELESVIEAGIESFLKTGLAFARIRFYKLHRATHDRFEDYCRDRWALSLSRCNQIIATVKVVTNITGAFPQDAALLAETNEHTLRPLSRLEPELQTVTWELIRHIEERPSGTTVEQVGLDDQKCDCDRLGGARDRLRFHAYRRQERSHPAPAPASCE